MGRSSLMCTYGRGPRPRCALPGELAGGGRGARPPDAAGPLRGRSPPPPAPLGDEGSADATLCRRRPEDVRGRRARAPGVPRGGLGLLAAGGRGARLGLAPPPNSALQLRRSASTSSRAPGAAPCASSRTASLTASSTGSSPTLMSIWSSSDRTPGGAPPPSTPDCLRARSALSGLPWKSVADPRVRSLCAAAASSAAAPPPEPRRPAAVPGRPPAAVVGRTAAASARMAAPMAAASCPVSPWPRRVAAVLGRVAVATLNSSSVSSPLSAPVTSAQYTGSPPRPSADPMGLPRSVNVRRLRGRAPSAPHGK